MGIPLYVLTHTRQIEGTDYTDYKLIGVFSSTGKIEQVLKQKLCEPGFKDYPLSFKTQTLILDTARVAPSEVYLLQYVVPYADDYYEQVEDIGVFTNTIDVELCIKKLCSDGRSEDKFFYEEKHVDFCGWQGGFTVT